MSRYAASATAGILGVRRFGYYTDSVAAPPAEFSPLDLSPALWVDPSDASSVTISGSSGAYIGANGLVLPGLSDNDYGMFADLPAYTVTDEFEVLLKLTPTTWAQTATVFNCMSFGAANAGWRVTLASGVGIYFSHSDGATTVDSLSSANHTLTGTGWIKVTYKGSLGEVKFYQSTDGSSFTQVGTTQTTTLTAGWNSSNQGRIGVRLGGGVRYTGTVHRAAFGTTIGGAYVFDADFEAATPFVSAFTESALGAPVYVVSSTATSATASYAWIGPTGLVYPGTSGHLCSTPDSAANSITGDIEIQVKCAAVDWTPAAQQVILGKTNAAGSADAYFLRLQTSGVLSLNIHDSIGVVSRAYTSTATVGSAGYADGATVWLKATLDVDTGASSSAAQFFTSPDGTTWTQLGADVTIAAAVAITDRDGVVAFGKYGNWDSSQQFAGTIMRAIVKSGIGGTTVIDADFTAAADYCTSFTESSSNAATVTITATNTPANAAGACVSQINDKSGNSRHLTQGTLANMPKYWNGRNGCNILVFDGTSDALTHDAGSDVLAFGSGFVAFTAARNGDTLPLGASEYRRLLSARRASTASGDSGSPNAIPLYINATGGNLGAGSAGTITAATGSVVGTVPFQGTSVQESTTLLTRKDGSASSTTAVSASGTLQYLRLGASCGAAGNPPVLVASEYWMGEIGETALVLGAVADLATAETYWKTKWGTP